MTKKAGPEIVLPPEQLAVIERFRSERELEHFSQYELAKELGVTRTALSSYELHRASVSFRIGWEFCRRLDLNQRWLATGEEPRRPFVPPCELNLSAAEERDMLRRRIDFRTGYLQYLEFRFDRWVKQNPPERLVERMLSGGLAHLARRYSNRELVSQIRELMHAALGDSSRPELATARETFDTYLAELESRLNLRKRER